MRDLKIAVIGSGSTYTPEMIQGFIQRKEVLHVKSFYMMDIDRKKNEIVAGLTQRMLAANGMSPEFVLTEALKEAIEGADYVLAQIRVGMLEARIRDETIPLKYGLLGQETTGAGGFMNALRTIPVILHIARLIETLAPNAWFINFSNPSGIMAEAVLNRTNAKMIGLCNVPTVVLKDAALRTPPGTKKFDYDYVGLNHLAWLTAIYADGSEILQQQLLEGTDIPGMKNTPAIPYPPEMLRQIGGIPANYPSYFYFRNEHVRRCMEAPECRGEVCRRIEAKLLEMYRDPNLTEKPALLEQRGGAYYSEAAVSLIESIENDKNDVHVVNVLNNGAFSFMSDDDAVEVKCVVNRKGATPVPLHNFENRHIIGLMQAVKAYEKLTVKAAVSGNYDLALQALLVHPLIGDYPKAKAVLDEMLAANRAYLPTFFQ